MTVTAIHKDADAMTMTLTAEFDASPARVWDLWADPRQLERWWGPPSYPATFTRHDLAPGSHVEYHLTGPSGDQVGGSWDVLEADPPRRLVFVDGSTDTSGAPNAEFARDEHPDIERLIVTIESIDPRRTRMSIEFQYAGTPVMEHYMAMGQEQGLTQAVGQIDAILTEGVPA